MEFKQTTVGELLAQLGKFDPNMVVEIQVSNPNDVAFSTYVSDVHVQQNGKVVVTAWVDSDNPEAFAPWE
jgi:hypothetical protein